MKIGQHALLIAVAVALVVSLPAAAQRNEQAAANAVAKIDNPRFRETGQPLPPGRGQQIFVAHCALCHGIDGRGDGPRSAYFQPGVQFIPDFSTPGYLAGRDQQVLQSIREGLKRLPEPAIVMPQFKYILGESEMRSVLVYVKSLAGPSLQKGAAAAQPAAVDGEALAKKYNCLACHQVGSKVVGPAYRDVAAKYKGQSGAASQLAQKIRKGSAGVWGDIPMPPKAEVPDAEMQKLVDWILSRS